MAYIIGMILILIAFIILGLILRKKVYDEVDRMESWKMDIMNRNVTAELSRIKDLNLSGETQEKFESWKERWDFILTRELPDIEEYLFDAEESADRYRFRSAKKNIRSVKETLKTIETDIEQVLSELEDLLDSEKNSREEMEELRPNLKALRKELLQNRHSYGKAEIRFEVEIDELEEGLANAYQMIDSGNYSDARIVVEELKNSLYLLEIQIQEFPTMYKKVKQELPSQIDDLLSGIKDMKESGYRIEHLGFEKELHRFQERLLICLSELDKGELEQAQQVIPEIDERLKEMYQLLEKEAVAKKYIENHIKQYRELITESSESFDETTSEVETLQKAYYFEDADLETHLNLEKWMSQLRNQFAELENELGNDKMTHIDLREKLETGFQELEDLEIRHKQFKEHIRTLRKDELQAKEKITDMRRKLYQTNRKLQKSNIPGVPSYIWELIETAMEKSEACIEKLQKQPLDMGEVQQALKEAEKAVQTTIDQTELLLDQANLVEVVIQYANRYRSQYPLLSSKLAEAEAMFRNFEYENALEQSMKALEAVDPGAIKRLEEHAEIPS
ncbi:septation ring formation regulator EzrA [Aquibacillus sp. 3ASR75-11]|uniref:Septation ring formation regulator EzrA n=1 Tax=Terrihalobacillus insolitus TaxID=2950438 RepID=A0A9X3WV74_9BACI|nr:septation ring formation regulator EzrA [Terrihalobacillus insolitus]MDC3412669.1 septation ring formation regulator EzrA [Terrihalobacillus insolitus]MDC3424019.1 septation ring formation regulator EzrA [Terrihalobacillus insolitus]